MAVNQNLDLALFEGVGDFDVPELQPVYELPKVDKWIEFEWAKNKRVKHATEAVHFFQEDFKFESVWTFPERYLETLKSYACVLTPDFSMHTNFPLAMQIFNHYRTQWIGAYWQMNGVCVIPTIQWSTPDNYDWCFDGVPHNSIVAVSNIGANQTKQSKEYFKQGYEYMLEELQPTKILFYSNSYPEGFDGNIHFIKYNIDKSIGR